MPGNIHLTTFMCYVLAGLAPFYPNGLSENKNVTEIHGVPSESSLLKHTESILTQFTVKVGSTGKYVQVIFFYAINISKSRKFLNITA